MVQFARPIMQTCDPHLHVHDERFLSYKPHFRSVGFSVKNTHSSWTGAFLSITCENAGEQDLFVVDSMIFLNCDLFASDFRIWTCQQHPIVVDDCFITERTYDITVLDLRTRINEIFSSCTKDAPSLTGLSTFQNMVSRNLFV
jgi:hypothetical protein